LFLFIGPLSLAALILFSALLSSPFMYPSALLVTSCMDVAGFCAKDSLKMSSLETVMEG
jgi:hypothetical protein